MKNKNKFFISACVVLFSAWNVCAEMTVEMGYETDTPWPALETQVIEEVFNEDTAEECLIKTENGKVKKSTVCNTEETFHYEIATDDAFLEVSLTENSKDAKFTSIIVRGSTNTNGKDGQTAGVVFSDKYPFDENSAIGGESLPMPRSDEEWADLEVVSIPEGARSFRIYRRVYYWEDTSTSSINAGSSSGRVQLGTRQSLRIAYIGVTIEENDDNGGSTSDFEVKSNKVFFDGKTIKNPDGEQVQVYDAAGNLIVISSQDINLSDKPRGIYIVKTEEIAFKITLSN